MGIAIMCTRVETRTCYFDVHVVKFKLVLLTYGSTWLYLCLCRTYLKVMLYAKLILPCFVFKNNLREAQQISISYSLFSIIILPLLLLALDSLHRSSPV